MRKPWWRALLLLVVGLELNAAVLTEPFDTPESVGRWRFWRANHTGELKFDPAVGHTRPGSACFVNCSRAAFSFPVPLSRVDGAILKFSFWIKTDAPGAGFTTLNIMPTVSWPGRGETITALSGPGEVLPITSDWQYRELYYQLPATRQYAGGRLAEVLLSCTLNISGRVWMDDVQCEIARPTKIWSENFHQPQAVDSWFCYAPGMIEGVSEIGYMPTGFADPGALKLTYVKGNSGYGATLKTPIPAARFTTPDQTLCGMVKVGPHAAALLAVEQFDADGKLIETTVSDTPLAPGVDYRPARLAFSVNPAAAGIRPFLINQKTGTIEFDNLYIRPADPAEKRRLAVAHKAPLWAIVYPADFFGYIDSKPPEITLTQGRANLIFLMLAGNKDLTGDTVVELELPDHLKLLTAQLGTYGSAPLPIRELKADHPGIRRYRFVNPYDWQKRMMGQYPNYYTGLLLALASDAAPGTPGNLELDLKLGENQGEKRSLPIRILPAPAPAPKPDGFTVGSYGLNPLHVVDEPTRRALLKGYLDSGIRFGAVHANQPFAAATADKLGFQANVSIHGPDYAPVYTIPTPRTVLADGCQEKTGVALGAALTDPKLRENYREYLKGCLALLSPDVPAGAFIDIEFWGNGRCRQSCFHPSTIAEFRKFAHLNADVPLDAATILKQYTEQWSAFRNDCTVRLHRLTRDLLRELRSNTELMAYDYTLKLDGTPQNFIADAPMNTLAYDRDDAVDVHLVSYYNYEGVNFLDHAEVDARTLQKPVYGVPYISEALPAVQSPSCGYHHPSAPELRMEVLGAAASGLRGLAYFTGLAYDGERLNAVNEGMNAVAQYADFYLKGKRADAAVKLTGLTPEMRYRVHEFGGRKLLTVFNCGKTPQTIGYPGGSVTVPPNDFKQIKL